MATRTHRLRVAPEEEIVLDWTPPARSANGTPAPVAVFVHGLGSNRQGTKARTFQTLFTGRGWGYLALDLRGHGDSGGGMNGLTLTRCLEDLQAALDWLAGHSRDGSAGFSPPLLIGSSMGAAVIAWQHVKQPQSAAAHVMIAPALTFPRRFFQVLGREALDEWRRDGTRAFSNQWMELQLDYTLLEDAENYPPEILAEEYSLPTLLIHGMQDESVDWQGSLDFVRSSPCPELDLLLIKQGDHRLTDHSEYLFHAMWSWLEQRMSMTQPAGPEPWEQELAPE
ncbi:MAG: lysophospholipase [Deltaproteobacteria bacterium]|nr:lysophospholipase [Deltaproteobacteria bacterium]